MQMFNITKVKRGLLISSSPHGLKYFTDVVGYGVDIRDKRIESDDCDWLYSKQLSVAHY